jgi:NitT/TauT family transport system ATP-binding protein
MTMRSVAVSDVQAAAAPPTQPILETRELTVRYGVRARVHTVLKDVNVSVQSGEFLCIVGPSGAGKTTLLRCMLGLSTPTSGAVFLDGERIERPSTRIAAVFQDYGRSLMPWMTVEGNVVLPLRRMSKLQRELRARSALAAVGLAGVAERYPWQLSGGMQQRVAIARALAFQPDVLLMDEPFASVDAQTRSGLEDLILSVRKDYGITVVLVTHDIDEAVYLGDEVVVISGSPARVRDRIRVDLGNDRDQLSTKALPAYTVLRTKVLTLIRAKSL